MEEISRKEMEEMEEMEEISREDVLEAARRGSSEYNEMIDDKELILEAMQINPKAVLYATDELIADDEELALVALEYNSYYYVNLSYELQQKEIIIDKMLESSLQEKENLIKEGKYVEGASLQTAMYDISQAYERVLYWKGYSSIVDRENAIMLVEVNGNIYKYLDEDLRDDKEIFLKALEGDSDDPLIVYAGDTIREDKELILTLLEEDRNPYYIQEVSDELKSDREVVFKALECLDKNDGVVEWLENIDEAFKSDREFILEAVKKDGLALEWASDKLKEDRDIVIEAVCNTEYALEFASEELQKDDTIMEEVIRRNTEEQKKLEEQKAEGQKKAEEQRNAKIEEENLVGAIYGEMAENPEEKEENTEEMHEESELEVLKAKKAELSQKDKELEKQTESAKELLASYDKLLNGNTQADDNSNPDFKDE